MDINLAILSTLQHPIVILLDSVINTDFLIIIIVCIAVTVFFDVLRHPGGSTQFIWRHWWQIPLLAYILFPVAVIVPPMVNAISPVYGVASVVVAAAIILFLWAFITSGDPFYLPSDSPQKKRTLKLAKKLLSSGGFGSLSILTINSAFWFPLPVWLGVLVISLLLYTIGYLLRYNASRSPEPKEKQTPLDPSHREPRRTEPDMRL